jgi:hypothetical protein
MSRPLVTKIYLVTAALSVLAGYVDLWHGGTSVAASLLVLGYCVLLPIALWRSGSTAESNAPPYASAALVFALILTLYILTLAPSTAMWDASEYIAVAKILGLPHPPGNPMFVLIAHVAGLVPIPVEYAVRINLLAAVASAASAALWFLCGERLMRGIIPDRWPRLVAAAASAMIGATSFTVWNQSVVNEKVYTVSMLGLALSSWLLLRWLDATEVPPSNRHALHGDRLLIAIAYLAGIAYTVHPAGLLAAPAAGLAVLVRRPRLVLRWRLLAALAGALAIGLTPFAVEPIRSAHLPAINEGLPTACEGGKPELECTLSAETWKRFSANVKREQYGGHAVLQRQAPFDAQLAMFWQYFRWQWIRDADADDKNLQSAATVMFLALGLAGLAAMQRRERAASIYFLPLAITLTIALVFYLNFKYGWSQVPELGASVVREVRERDYFFVWTFSIWGLFAGLGLAAGWRALSDLLARRGAAGRAWLLTAPVMLTALLPLVANWSSASRAGQRFTSEWARDVLSSVEPYSVLITAGDNDSFPLWYAQQVEGFRRDVTVALTPYLGLRWYGRELLKQPLEPYDVARGPSMFRDSAWTPPTRPLWSLTPTELDAVPDYVELKSPHRFTHGALEATIPPGYLTRDQLLMLRTIKDSFPQRPVYFTLGSSPHELGLGRHVRRVGLVQKIEPQPLAPRPDLIAERDGFFDVALTRELWDTVYRGHHQLLREGRWIDGPSSSIPAAYAFTGQQLAFALGESGQIQRAKGIMDTVMTIARIAGLRVQE